MSSTRTLAPQPHCAVPAVVAAIYPDASAAQQLEIFQNCAEHAGPEVAERFFQECLATIRSGIVFGAPVPPPGVELRRVNLEHLQIFYHSTFPEDLQGSNPFTWNFYIGLRGKGPESIIKDLGPAGIAVTIVGLTGKWEACNVLTVMERTRARISYTGRRPFIREIEFPADPRAPPVLQLV
ncbi:hypothetical protein DFH09DRAFT_1164131 [Mycena vulgaris]|nr:hypothetical protein DFH09DRAFT_1292040 [Mycena vulgaris]KAJ6514008.1 hypothetical protein DFH09DRAFT_1374154 [Mycena vulgaris]KAJ6556967.1 hypothetical protein DFH09DRAFT_1164131 [Mycena vulgaris]